MRSAHPWLTSPARSSSQARAASRAPSRPRPVKTIDRPACSENGETTKLPPGELSPLEAEELRPNWSRVRRGPGRGRTRRRHATGRLRLRFPARPASSRERRSTRPWREERCGEHDQSRRMRPPGTGLRPGRVRRFPRVTREPGPGFARRRPQRRPVSAPLPGYTQLHRQSGMVGPPSLRRQGTSRCAYVLVKSDERTEAGVPRREASRRDGDVHEYAGERRRLVAGEVCTRARRARESASAARRPRSPKGPSRGPRGLVAGFWLWKSDSLEEAIDWARRAPFTEPSSRYVRSGRGDSAGRADA